MSTRVQSALAVATAVVAFALQVRADVTYYVALGGDGTDPTSGDLAKAYAHPQDAIDAATGEELVTVKIAAGTYTVRNFATDPAVINIVKSNVSVEAIGSGEVIIDGESRSGGDIKNTGKKTNCAVMVAEELTGVSVRGIVFQNGSTVATTAHLAEPYSSTLYAASGLFRDCRFVGKNFCYCSTMWLTGSSVASNCTFTLAEKLGSTSYGYGDYAVAVYGQAKVVDSTLEELWRFSKAPIRPMIIGGTAVISNSVIRNTKLGRPKNFSSARGYGDRFRRHRLLSLPVGFWRRHGDGLHRGQCADSRLPVRRRL